MNNEQEKESRISEKVAAMERLLADQRCQVQMEVLANATLRETLWVARKTAILGAIPSLLWCFAPPFQSGQRGWLILFIDRAHLLFILGISPFAIASASGLFAYFWFRNSTFPVHWAATILTIAGSAVLLGWIVTLT
jgi:hypothetical protein